MEDVEKDGEIDRGTTQGKNGEKLEEIKAAKKMRHKYQFLFKQGNSQIVFSRWQQL